MLAVLALLLSADDPPAPRAALARLTRAHAALVTSMRGPATPAAQLETAKRGFLSALDAMNELVRTAPARVKREAPLALELVDGWRPLALALSGGSDGTTWLEPFAYEAVDGLNGLYAAEQAFFGEHQTYTGELAAVGFMPAPCVTGRTPRAPRGSMAGCHFTYAVVVAGGSFEAIATGASPTTKGHRYRLTAKNPTVTALHR